EASALPASFEASGFAGAAGASFLAVSCPKVGSVCRIPRPATRQNDAIRVTMRRATRLSPYSRLRGSIHSRHRGRERIIHPLPPRQPGGGEGRPDRASRFPPSLPAVTPACQGSTPRHAERSAPSLGPCAMCIVHEPLGGGRDAQCTIHFSVGNIMDMCYHAD